MRTNDMGKMLGKLRRKSHISQQLLCKGLCSKQMLSFIENGERVPDILLLEALLQRLGKSTEKFELIISMEEYEKIEKREEIEYCLRMGMRDKAAIQLAEYQKNYGAEGKIQKIYCQTRTGILWLTDGKIEEAEKILLETLNKIIPQWEDEGLEMKLLAGIEIETILLLAQLWIRQGKTTKAQNILEELMRYIRKNITDEEEYIKQQSRVAALLGEQYNQQGRYQETINLCEEVFKLEREHFIIQCMTLLMENLIEAYRVTDRMSDMVKLSRWKKELEEIFTECGLTAENINAIFCPYSVRQYYLDCEIVRGERLQHQMTQEELCEGVYESVESLSRVENGREHPNRIKFELLMEQLELEKAHYNGYLDTDRYEILEQYCEIEKQMSRKQYQSVDGEIPNLKNKIDETQKSNLQYLGGYQIIQNYKNGQVTAKQAKEQYEKLLILTYPFPAKKTSRVPFLTEMFLYNKICQMEKKSGQLDEATEHFEKLFERYRSSRVAEKFHFRSVSLILVGMVTCMEIQNRVTESRYWSEWWLHETLLCGKSSGLENILANLGCVAEKSGEKKETCGKYFQHAFYMCELFEQGDHKKNALEAHIRANYSSIWKMIVS
jgi:transcriptional regulator with XRE-family HTH domain